MATFCTKCGSSRAVATRFCVVCGASFSEPGISPAGSVPLPAARPSPGPAPTDPPYSWPAPDLPAPDLPAPPPPDPRQRSGQERWMSFVIAAVAVMVLASGGAYALVWSRGGKGPARRPAHPIATASASRSAGVLPGNVPTPTGAASSTASARPTPRPSATRSPGEVFVMPGLLANPATADVVKLLNRYFNAINTRDYAEYRSLLDAQMRAGESASSFDSGYATTKDSAATLAALSNSGGDEAATVSFTSHQSPADSANGSACTDWTITLYLVPRSNGYVIAHPPSGYHAAYRDCP